MLAIMLTLMGAVAALWPMLRSRQVETMPDNEGTRRVLVDQFDEIERDRDRGLINQDEAESARAEIGRRLLALEREEEIGLSGIGRSGRLYPWVSIVLIPVLTVGAYTYFGAPGLPDQPIASRLDLPDDEQDINVLVARVENHLVQNPDDLRGWQTLAPIYHRMRRADEAENAYRRWLALVGDDAVSKGTAQNGLGQVLAAKQDGEVRGEAFELFQAAKRNAPDDPTGYFFEALGLTQAGKREEALIAWETVVARFSDENPPWLPIAQQTLAVLKAENGEAANNQTSGPTADDIRDAEALSANERRTLVEGMVARLADRLVDNPDDLTGWSRLIQSYMVLEEKDKAVAALAKARDAMAGNVEALTALDALEKQFDL
ncbi:MAG: c-type cytochrome biogenesis protein CcmI [Pseudomonadota bacterium]